MTRSLPLALLASLPATASGQSFNIDVGDQAVPYGLPSPACGGGAGQTGQWFPASPNPGTQETLTDLSGLLTAVTITHSGGFGAFDYPSPGLTGDDQALMDDCQDVGGGSTTWTIANLAAGNYALYTYAWAPDSPLFVSGVSGGSIDPSQNLGGPWPGMQVQGITYAVHHYVVAAGGSISVTISAVTTFGTVNGFQLVETLTPQITLFCFGDGSGTACPCGPGTANNGCPNSINANGAHLAASGLASIAADTFVIAGTGMPASVNCLYFQALNQIAGGAGSVFGDGLRCISGAVIRLGTKLNSGGASQYPDTGDPAISVRGAIPPGGGTRYYQGWYRNANPTFCTAETFNLTNAAGVTWVP